MHCVILGSPPAPAQRGDLLGPRLADQIAPFVPMHYTMLGSDGFGCSDTRANLRRHFEAGRHYIAQGRPCALAAGK